MLKTLSAFFILCLSLGVHSQVCTPNFQKTYGGNGDDQALDIQVTSDGGFIVAGRTTSNAMHYNGFLLKLSEQGSIQWVKSYGGFQDGELSRVTQTTDGGFLAGGTTHAFGQPLGAVWIVKTDALGSLQWARQYSTLNDVTKLRDMRELTDGSLA